MNSEHSTKTLPILALILVQLIFGFNYAASKVILVEFPPILWAGTRLAIASFLMFALSFAIVPKEKRRMDADFLKRTFFYGLIGITMNQAFFLVGLKYTTTTNAAILNTLTPIFTLLFGIIAGAEKLNVRRGIGFALAVLGALFIRRFEDFNMTSDTFKGDLFTLANCMALALFLILARSFLRQNSPFWATAWMFLFGSIELLAVSFSQIPQLSSIHFSGLLVFAIFYNIVLATMVTYYLNAWTVTKVNPSSVAIFIYFQPVIAVLNAWYLGGELPNSRVLLAMSLIFSGVAVGVIKGAEKKT
jgi:drug/metabolite transporter (DMT)-like permease